MTMSAHEEIDKGIEDLDAPMDKEKKTGLAKIENRDIAQKEDTAITFTVETQAYVDALMAAGYDDVDRVRKAISAGGQFGMRPLRSLMRAGIPIELLEKAAWTKQGYETIDLTLAMVDRERFSVIPISSAKRLMAAPVKTSDGHLQIAVCDPTNIVVLDDINELFSGEKIDIVVAEAAAIRDVLTVLESRERSQGLEVEKELEVEKVEEIKIIDGDGEGKTSKLVKTLVENAAKQGASDVHIEPNETEVIVRYRKDGVLHVVGKYPISYASGMINRLKVMSNLDVGERRIPQDGRFGLVFDDRSIDLRLVTLPTSWGIEGAVMRILDRSSKVTKLEEMGYSKQVLDRYVPLITATQGTLLATGPTGSGKTTALYATLDRIATPDLKVLTIEDPVEYRFSGITQVQVNVKAGMTFARALRSFMRADPDVILVGELRDGETASIGVQAALTGHFVMATVHANSAAGVPTRLIDMGVEPFLVSSSVRGVISQRLVRKLCHRCYIPFEVSNQIKDSFPWQNDPPSTLYKANTEGCAHCHRTGYTGRTTIAEVLVFDDEISHLVSRNATTHEIENAACAGGMTTILQDGLDRAAKGITSIEELSRVVG